jgi:hypothetical protein
VGFELAAAGAFLGACLLLVLILGGCSSSTEPEVVPDPEVSFAFSPAGQRQELLLNETILFSASVRPAAGLSAKWYRGGVLVGEDSILNYIPEKVGLDTLGVRAFSGADQDTYYWVMDVQPEVSFLPPEVANVEVQAGPKPAEVKVRWNRVNNATFPLVEYMVAVSYSGSINEDNWGQATILGRFDHDPALVFYSQDFNEADDGLRPGEQAWFGVRVRDDRQQMSPLTSSVRYEITWPWYLGGHVTDDAGLSLPVVGVTTGEFQDNTDGRGVFLFNEPFRNIDSVRVATSSSPYFNYTTPPVSVDQETTQVDITLINRYALANPGCWTGSFLEYLRDMTRTVDVPGQPAESQLFSWSEFPVSVFIPPGVENLAFVDMESACMAALDFWNDTMRNDAQNLGITESDYFVRTSNESTADIVFLFDFRSVNYGETTLELPTGHDAGEVVPEKMQIWVNTTADLDLFSEVQGVAVHEFGHTLGLFNHADCPGVEYLMQPGGGSAAMGRAEPIHLDERRAVRAIRNIPQGANMSDYTFETSGLVK